MARNNTRLELTWIGKENRTKLEPRILIENPAESYHAAHRVSENDLFDNRLIFGDNLLALKALEQEFTGKIKCIYIDPPYNTGSVFEHVERPARKLGKGKAKDEGPMLFDLDAIGAKEGE